MLLFGIHFLGCSEQPSSNQLQTPSQSSPHQAEGSSVEASLSAEAIDKPTEPPEIKSLFQRIEQPIADQIVMAELNNEQVCVSQFQECECFKSDTDWLCFPKYHATIRKIGVDTLAEMQGQSWTPDCPLGPSDLRLVHVLHWSSETEVRWGELVVAADAAEVMVSVFRDLYRSRFLVPSIRRIDHYEANDDLSMNANNTSAFNCRKVKGTEVWSQHSYGNAIDINPLWNPWVRGTVVDPPAAEAFVDRETIKPGMISAGDVVVRAFEAHDWKWGGDWTGKKDYQHFSVNGR